MYLKSLFNSEEMDSEVWVSEKLNNHFYTGICQYKVCLVSRELIPFQGAALSKLFLLPSKKGSILKGKNLLPQGACCFFLE